ncbi:MAG: hypothetical protein ACE5MI_06005 [Acidimicrobiia bacterium]
MINSADDPLDHPDLTQLARRMREQLEEVLAAEQAAAAAMARRQLTLRDRLCDLEDLAAEVTVRWASGRTVRGVVSSVGLDYFEIRGQGERVLVPFHLTAWIET